VKASAGIVLDREHMRLSLGKRRLGAGTMTNTAGDKPRSCKPNPINRVAVVDPNRCEAKGECVSVCPYDVFELRTLTRDERSELSVLGRLRYATHGRKSATTPGVADCHACGLCVKTCPENAIKLVVIITPDA
jgi:NAD-dependent dihydropyrimidine dehydrogenase PreA subunit